MQKKKAKIVDLDKMPAVIEFIDARDALEEFKADHGEVFSQLQELTERYNTTLEQADKACRAGQVSCGPFDLYQFSIKYDAEALHNAIGRDKFLEAGGKIETKTVYDVDRGRLEACIAQNKIPADVVERVLKETPNFHKPDKLVIP